MKKNCASFEPKLRVTFEKARERGEGIAISNCMVQEARVVGVKV